MVNICKPLNDLKTASTSRLRRDQADPVIVRVSDEQVDRGVHGDAEGVDQARLERRPPVAAILRRSAPRNPNDDARPPLPFSNEMVVRIRDLKIAVRPDRDPIWTVHARARAVRFGLIAVFVTVSSNRPNEA